MSNENVNVTKGWLLSFYNQKIKPYLNGATGAIDDSSTASNKTWSSSKINEKIDTASKHTYSTTEKAIGTWTDGRTVYEKVFKGTLSSSTGSTSISIGSNISSFIDFKGFIKNTSTHNDVTIPYTANNGQTLTVSFLPNASTSSPKNLISINNNISSFVSATYTVIVQYTKV